jgi:hypothetical protein
MHPQSSKRGKILPNLAYVFSMMLGLILGLLAVGSFNVDKFLSLLVAGISTSLIATGIVGLFTLWIIAPQNARRLEEMIKDAVGFPARILPERRFINKQYVELTEAADRIDVISLSLYAFYDNYPREKLVEWIKEKGKKFRVLVLSPEGRAAELRSMAENIDLGKKIRESLWQFQKICDRAESDLNKGSEWAGGLEIRTYDSIPYFAYFRADQQMIVGLYYSHVPGTQSEAILIQKGDGPIYDKMKGHFEALWDGTTPRGTPPDNRQVCSISGSTVKFLTPAGANPL